MDWQARFRFFVTVLTLVIITVVGATAPAAAVEGKEWIDTVSREKVLVQDCRGPSILSGYGPVLTFGFDFEIITNFSTVRTHQVVDNVERRYVSFMGIAANSKYGLSLAYDGHFTRTGDYPQGDFTITDLTLHLVPFDADEVTVTVDRDSSGVIETPQAMLLAFAPRGLHMSLCSYFAGLKVAE